MGMKKICALLAAAVMVCTAGAALADGMVMAGYEGADTGRLWENNRFFQRMEERTGLSFTFREFRDAKAYDTWIDGLTAGGELPDVLFKASLSGAQVSALYEKGVLIDLRPLLPECAPHLWALLQENPDRLRTAAMDDGAIAALPLIDPIQANNVFWINEDWLSTLKLSMPATAEELTAVLTAFRDGDPNRNGRRDEVPLTFSSTWDLRFLQHAFGIITNDYYQYTDDGGRVSCPLFTEDNRAWLAWMHTLWQEGLLDHIGFTSAAGARQITDSDAVIPYGVVCGPTPAQLLPAAAASSYTALQPLTWKEGRIYRSLLGDVSGGTFAVTSHCADPAAVLAWVDFLYTEEGYRLAHLGKEGEEYEIRADGTWTWMYDVTQARNTIRRDSVIADGSQVPGWIPVEAQAGYSDAASRKLVRDLAALAAYSREACPQVSFTAEERAELQKLWPPLSRWCEEHMTWFITGDLPLNDETWTAFADGAADKGMARVTAIWQQAVDRYRRRDTK